MADSTDEKIVPSEFDSLILDDHELNRELTVEDKAYLEEFVNVELLSFSNTGLRSLRNLPELPELKRIELNGNGLPAAALKDLLKYKQLHTIKFEGNNVSEYADLEPLKDSLFGNLSFAGNPIASKADYREEMFKIFPELQLLDGKNAEGESVASDEDIDSDYGEEGEQEIDEETRNRLREQGFDLEDDDDEDGEVDFGDDFEEGEDNLYGDEDGEDSYDDEEEEPAQKRQKK